MPILNTQGVKRSIAQIQGPIVKKHDTRRAAMEVVFPRHAPMNAIPIRNPRRERQGAPLATEGLFLVATWQFKTAIDFPAVISTKG
jgi:hypothetical protein